MNLWIWFFDSNIPQDLLQYLATTLLVQIHLYALYRYVVRTVCYSECTANSRSHTLNISSLPREILMLSLSIQGFVCPISQRLCCVPPLVHPSPIFAHLVLQEFLFGSFWPKIIQYLWAETQHCRAPCTACQVDSTLGLVEMLL
eukprot:s1971_g15.t1